MIPTEAIVLGSRKLGEADRIVDLFSEGLGRVPTVVKGVRKVKSRWGGRLEPFTHISVQLHRGRSLYTLTGADTIRTNAALRDDPRRLKAGVSVAEMISRTTPELHRKPRTYNLALSFILALGGLPGGSVSGDSAMKGSSDPAITALAAELKMLLLAGFLPHLGSCASCGSEVRLSAFSAKAGGALCPACRSGGFAMAGESLSGMKYLLENPLLEAREAGLAPRQQHEIRRAIREICEFHLGVRLKVEPWPDGPPSR